MTTEFQREQEERRRTLDNDRRVREQQQGATLSDFATAEAAEDRGRFTAHEKSTVVGSTPNPATAYPQGPAWSATELPDEPPLGVSVEDHEPTGTAAEVQASIDELAKAEDDEPPEAA
jgi:hypothetical protein